MTEFHDLPPGTTAMIAAPQLDPALLRALTAEFSRRGAVHAAETADFPTRDGAVQAVRWSVSLADSDDDFGTQMVNSLLEDAAEQLPEELITTTVVPARQRPRSQAMLIMDVDSTLIDQEVIDLLAAHAGREADVAAVTERAMRGELDFTASLHARVAALKDLPHSVLAEVFDQVTPTLGAAELLAHFRHRSWPAYAVSGGFLQILTPLAESLGLTGYHANDLRISEGRLVGEVSGDVVDRTAKRQWLLSWAAENRLDPRQVIAVGDGANDLDMVTAAGTGVAFCAKPALAEAADIVINHRNMELISFCLGLSRR